MIKVKVGTICAEVARVISGLIDTNCYHLLLSQNHSELKSKHILSISRAVTNAAMICSQYRPPTVRPLLMKLGHKLSRDYILWGFKINLKIFDNEHTWYIVNCWLQVLTKSLKCLGPARNAANISKQFSATRELWENWHLSPGFWMADQLFCSLSSAVWSLVWESRAIIHHYDQLCQAEVTFLHNTTLLSLSTKYVKTFLKSSPNNL